MHELMDILPANKKRLFWAVGLLAVVLAAQGVVQFRKGRRVPPRAVNAVRLFSNSFRIEKLYASMQGPFSYQTDIHLGEVMQAKRYWVTGVKLRVVNEEATREESQDLFCHANLTLPGDGDKDGSMFGTISLFKRETPLEQHRRLNPENVDLDNRLFTLVPGRSEIRLPEGFGIPMVDQESLDFMTMALNLNEPRLDKQIRFSSDISVSTNQSLRPVFRRALYCHVTATAETKPRPDAMCVAPATGEKAVLGASCGPDTMGFRATEIFKAFGENQIVHWIVPPGDHYYTNDVTAQLKLAGNTTIHYATGHLHPFGKRLVLIERKPDGKETAVLTITARCRTDRLGIEEMSEVKTVTGIPVHNESSYFLISEYDNDRGQPTDAMAILYLYLAEGNPGAISELRGPGHG